MSYFARANQVASQIPAILENRGLPPLITRFVFTERENRAWLLAVLDQGKIARIERYTSPDLIHQLSTALGGLPVVLSNSTGLRYAVLLSPPPRLPRVAPFPGWQAGRVLLGQGKQGQAATDWAGFGHAIIAGMTRFGKSNTLRLVAAQALADGHQLIIVDPDGSTFPDLSGHDQVLYYGQSPQAAHGALEAAQEVYNTRVGQGLAHKARGEQFTPERRVVVIIDEYNGLVMAGGGPRGAFANGVVGLAYGGLKFGIHLVLAGHEFTRDLVGPVAGQMVTRVCLPVRAPSISRVVVGRAGAEKVKTPGRALTDPWGWVQIYRFDYEDFVGLVEDSIGGDGLTDSERQLIEAIKSQAGGRVTFQVLQEKGLTRTQATRLRQDWVTRGLARQAPEQDNSLVLADWVL